MATGVLADRLGVGRAGVKGLRGLLRELEAGSRIERIRGRWRRARADGLVEAVVGRDGRSASAGGRRRFALARTEQARPGDRVLLDAGSAGHRAEVLQVVDGFRDRWVGIFERSGSIAWISPYRDRAEWRVRVARSDCADARPGEVVAALPVDAPGRRRKRGRSAALAWARVVERLGRPGDARADFAAVVWRHRLPTDFPEPALAQASALSAGLGPDERAGRVDLRARPFVTIDPADARDHDDAVHVEDRGGGGWRLSVAIADVAHFVPVGSPIDVEALRRGNSIYFPERAIPMLPERLSGDVCSLRPEEDRLAVVVVLDFDARGRRSGCRIERAVIRSRARLVYEDVAAVVDGRAGGAHAESLRALGLLSGRLAERRRDRSLDLDLPEPVFRWGADGRPEAVERAERTAAHRAIEEAMLAANRAVAETLVAARVPAVHRIHEPPLPADAVTLGERLASLGLLEAADVADLDARALSRALARARGHPAERSLHFAVLRAMRQARYAVEGRGHFALGFPDYVHFTSPIRRYADLVVHRVLTAVLAEERVSLTPDRAARIAARVSFRERLAVNAERERIDLARCAVMRLHVGEEAPGTITGIAPHGLYVTPDPWFVEGLIHISRLPGFLRPDPQGFALVADGSGARYALGDRVQIRVARADSVALRIDFDLLEVLSPRSR